MRLRCQAKSFESESQKHDFGKFWDDLVMQDHSASKKVKLELSKSHSSIQFVWLQSISNSAKSVLQNVRPETKYQFGKSLDFLNLFKKTTKANKYTENLFRNSTKGNCRFLLLLFLCWVICKKTLFYLQDDKRYNDDTQLLN